MALITCDSCGVEFKRAPSQINTKRGNYCSRACIIKRTKVECTHCHKGFVAAAYEIKTGKGRFCSQRCKGLYERKQITKPCDVCGQTFTRLVSSAKEPKYCSRSCYYKAMQKKGSIITSCEYCSIEIKRSPSDKSAHMFCGHTCRNLFYSRERNGEAYALLKEDWTKCARCGWDECASILVVHHKDRNNRNNHFTNRQILCWNCHMLEHYRNGDGPFHKGKNGRKKFELRPIRKN